MFTCLVHLYLSRSSHENYSGEKQLLLVRGDHNSLRGIDFLDAVSVFLKSVLKSNETKEQKVTKGKSTEKKKGKRTKSSDQPIIPRFHIPARIADIMKDLGIFLLFVEGSHLQEIHHSSSLNMSIGLRRIKRRNVSRKVHKRQILKRSEPGRRE